MTVATPDAPAVAGAPRKPRKIFLLIGVVLAIGLGIGLFTTAGTSAKSGAPAAGSALPAFSAPNLNGSGTVSVPGAGVGRGTPAVLLFFGNWCTVCHTELPPLAAAAKHQQAAAGSLARVHVVGVDSEDTRSDAQSFIHSSGVTFPVAYDPNLTITSGDYYFEGDPYAVFVNADGTINAIVRGPMSVGTFTANERSLIPSGS